jgi:uncharacterized protein YjhX (UPF0386 family)
VQVRHDLFLHTLLQELGNSTGHIDMDFESVRQRKMIMSFNFDRIGVLQKQVIKTILWWGGAIESAEQVWRDEDRYFCSVEIINGQMKVYSAGSLAAFRTLVRKNVILKNGNKYVLNPEHEHFYATLKEKRS